MRRVLPIVAATVFTVQSAAVVSGTAAHGGVEIQAQMPYSRNHHGKAINPNEAFISNVTLAEDNFGLPYDPLMHFQGWGQVVFAIASGKETQDIRARSVLETWCGTIQACIYFSDDQNLDLRPATIPIRVHGTEQLDAYERAQLRFLPILRTMRTMLIENHKGKFTNTKWVIMADDDSFIFYQNLLNLLGTMDHTQKIYTGNTLPKRIYPVNQDGSGKVLPVSTDIPFVCGGGGSVFSAVGLIAMEQIDECVQNSLPGGKWWLWQSDWMIGACANLGGMAPMDQPAGRFNQFPYSSLTGQIVPHDASGAKYYCDAHLPVDQTRSGICREPVSLHPVKNPEGMALLWSTWPNATRQPVYRAKVLMYDADERLEVSQA